MRLAVNAFILALVAVCLVVWGVGWQLLPAYRGKIHLPSLDAPVTVVFDRFAIPLVEAQSRQDAFRALGFLHAQERFLQMELTRRKMSGKLAEVFGEIALES
ncbi:MAG: penicillin acylase family protein, partial [Methylohalobius sp.]